MTIFPAGDVEETGGDEGDDQPGEEEEEETDAGRCSSCQLEIDSTRPGCEASGQSDMTTTASYDLTDHRQGLPPGLLQVLHLSSSHPGQILCQPGPDSLCKLLQSGGSSLWGLSGDPGGRLSHF